MLIFKLIFLAIELIASYICVRGAYIYACSELSEIKIARYIMPLLMIIFWIVVTAVTQNMLQLDSS